MRPVSPQLVSGNRSTPPEPARRDVTPVKLYVITVGHKPPAWITSGFQDYVRRMPRELPVVLAEIKPAHRPGTSPAQLASARAQEGARLLAAVPANSIKIALDEHGRALSTKQLAHQLEIWMEDGLNICFLIGGADGLDDEVKKTADLVCSLSNLTLPHALVRVVLAEQLYRAISIIRKHPYHRE